MGNVRIVCGAAVIIAILISAFLYTFYNMAQMSAHIDSIQIKINLLTANKNFSDEAADTAIRTREQIHEQARQSMREAEQALKDNGEWADQPVPNDVRELLKEQPRH